MPELPEVQTVVNSLAPALVGRIISRVNLRRADVLSPTGFDFASASVGRVVTGITRRGKRIVFELSDQNRFFIHLGMTGRLVMEPADAPLLPHTHLLIDFDQTQLRFCDPRRFGGIWWLGSSDTSEQNMGPEPLTLRVHQLARQLGRTTRAIKSRLARSVGHCRAWEYLCGRIAAPGAYPSAEPRQPAFH